MMIRVAIQDIEVEVEEESPNQSFEAFESILARVAGTAVALYHDMFKGSHPSQGILFKPEFDDEEDDA